MKRVGRALIGYLPQQQAVQLLHGEPTIPQDVKELVAQWSTARESCLRRDSYRSANPLIETPREAVSLAEAVGQRPDAKTLMADLQWSVEFADLTRSLLTYQAVVVTEGAEERVRSSATGNVKDLFDVCLPDSASLAFMGGYDQAQNTFTASSLNPNLRIGGFVTADMPTSTGAPLKVIGFNISFGSPFVQLTEYQGRWMVRDGHHRIYGLLKLGISKIPCIVVRARTFEETGAGRPGFFGYETMFSERPPKFDDFFSKTHSAEVKLQAVQKIVRLRAEEFAIPI